MNEPAWAGPGHLRSRVGAIPYQEVLYRKGAYHILTSSERNLNIAATNVWFHRHYVAWPIMLRGFCIAIGSTAPLGNSQLKTALYSAAADTKQPVSKIAGTEVLWENSDIVLAGFANIANSGRRKSLPQEVQVLVPGTYWVASRWSAGYGTGVARIEEAFDASLLPSGPTTPIYDLSATPGGVFGDPLPDPSQVSFSNANDSPANIVFGLLCNRIIP